MPSTTILGSVNLPAVNGVLAPQDNFVGRSQTHFGIGEIVNLSFTTPTGNSADQLGGLKWFIDSGAGTIIGGTDGQAVFTAPATSGRVGLVLKIMSGPNVDAIVFTVIIEIVAPSGAHMALGSGFRHICGKAGIGYKGNIFFLPTDVSFQQMQFQEGSVSGVASGYFSPYNGLVHRQTPNWLAISSGNSTDGCRLLVQDLVDSGNYPTTGFPDTFANGDFLWPIPWKQRVGSSPESVFMTANHHQTINPSGNVTIEKAGAGPFSKNVDDPTSDY